MGGASAEAAAGSPFGHPTVVPPALVPTGQTDACCRPSASLLRAFKASARCYRFPALAVG